MCLDLMAWHFSQRDHVFVFVGDIVVVVVAGIFILGWFCF